MNTYYEILGVNNNVSRTAIKEAYFTMIRKYQFENQRQKLMEVRMAYEILSNEKTRKEYDNIKNMPDDMGLKFEYVNELLSCGRFKNAILKLKELSQRYTEIIIIKSLLGIAYLQNRNTGSASNVFEQLVKLDSTNSSFHGNLAYAYLLRGWQKKAINQYEKAIALDEDNVFLTLELSEAYVKNGNLNKAKELLYELLDRNKVKESNEFFLEINIRLLILEVNKKDANYINNILDNIEVAVRNNVDLKRAISDMLFKLTNDIFYIDLDVARIIINRAFNMNPCEKIREYRDYVNRIDILQREMAGLVESSKFDSLFLEVIDSKLYKEEFDGIEIPFTPEATFLKNVDDKIENQIMVISKKAPKIYEELQEYFKKILNYKERNEMIKRIEREVEEYSNSIKGEFFKVDSDEMEAVMKEMDLF